MIDRPDHDRLSEPSDPIGALLDQYASAIRDRDVDRWSETWADDAEWVLDAERTAVGHHDISGVWRTAMARYRSVDHRYQRHDATLDHDRGTGYGRAHVVEVVEPLDGSRHTLHGYYDDRYVRVDGTWRFARRELIRSERNES